MKTYHSNKLGPVTIPAPDETDNWQWVRAELALEIQEQRDELLAALEAAYAMLPTTASPEEFLDGEGNWGLNEIEYRVAEVLANAIAATERRAQ